jgi:hypothetical protein
MIGSGEPERLRQPRALIHIEALPRDGKVGGISCPKLLCFVEQDDLRREIGNALGCAPANEVKGSLDPLITPKMPGLALRFVE